MIAGVRKVLKSSQKVHRRCIQGAYKVHARYMQGTCKVHASSWKITRTLGERHKNVSATLLESNYTVGYETVTGKSLESYQKVHRQFKDSGIDSYWTVTGKVTGKLPESS